VVIGHSIRDPCLRGQGAKPPKAESIWSFRSANEAQIYPFLCLNRTVFIFCIFHMYKNITVKLWCPASSEALRQVCHLCPWLIRPWRTLYEAVYTDLRYDCWRSTWRWFCMFSCLFNNCVQWPTRASCSELNSSLVPRQIYTFLCYVQNGRMQPLLC